MNARAVKMSAVLAALTGRGGGRLWPQQRQRQRATELPAGSALRRRRGRTWHFLGACTGPAFLQSVNDNLQASCPGASITALDIDVSGTVTYNADSTYTANAIETLTVMETIPLSCLAAASCAQAVSNSPDSTSRARGTTNCTCHVNGIAPQERDRHVHDHRHHPDHGRTRLDSTADAYCVQNDRLHIIGIDATTGALLGDFVAQKQ